MFGFSSKKKPAPLLKTPIGTFSFDGAGWITEPSGDLVFVSTDRVLDIASIDRTQILLRQIDDYRAAALTYASANGSDLWDGIGEPGLESIDITDILDGKFGLTFGFESSPDFTLTVEFENGRPIEVWAAD